MINAYEVAIKLKAEDQFSGALDTLMKYLGDASKKSAELEIKLERIGKLFKAVHEAGGLNQGLTQHAAANTHGAGKLRSGAEAASNDAAGRKSKAGKAAEGFIGIAGMGDAAASLNKLGKVLGEFSQKADKVSRVATSVGKVSIKLEGLAQKAGFDSVAAILGKVGNWMNDLAEKAKKVATVTKVLSQVAKVLADFAQKANSLASFAKMLNKLGPLLEGLGKVVGNDTLTKAGKAMKSLGMAFTKVLPVLQSFGKFFNSVIVGGLRIAGNAVLFLGRALMLNPIGLIVSAIAAAAYLLYKNWKTVGPYVMKAWEAIKTAFHVSAAWIAGKVQAMWNFVRNIFDGYVAAWTGIVKFIAGTVSSIYDTVTGWFGKIIDWVANSAIGKLFGMAADAGKSAPGAAGNATPENRKLPLAVVPAASKNIHVKTELHMDGKKVAETVTRHQERSASRPGSGTSCFDGNRALRPAGAGAGH